VRLHLAGVTFMDSSGLHVLLATQCRASLLGTDFGVVGLSPQVRRLQISGVARLLMGRSRIVDAPAEPDARSAQGLAGWLSAPFMVLSSRRSRQARPAATADPDG
jgi:hypothetical protein